MPARGDKCLWGVAAVVRIVPDWTQKAITINKTSSSECDLIYGVPQGSVLGSILFTCYTKPFGAIARERGLSSHMYADDTQLYIAFKPVGVGELATGRVEVCVDEMSSWMRKNKLQLSTIQRLRS